MRTHGETSAPQWSPPVMGGMTLTRVRLPPRPRQAAMEPARNGRDDLLAAALLVFGAGQAAMEPARNGRDDGHVDLHPAQDGLAAMEPAHGTIAGRGGAPQWSPPVMGGMTARVIEPPSQVQEPQWSPPVMGGMTPLRRRVLRGGHAAAMEPARNGRDDLTQSRYSQIGTGPPQWSPPVMGGMTLGRRRRRERDPRRAAMEPARNGRDDDRDRLPGHVDREAAMEPARNGRDDPMIVAGETGAPRVPQWSPPVMGGMTWLSVTLLASVSWPQWSPPVMGGMTGYPASSWRVNDAAAMEPARNGRDDQLEPAVQVRRVVAAMEPARNGRDDAMQHSVTVPAVLVAAMEPARNGRDDM